MSNMNIPNLAGFMVLLLVYVAFLPVINTAINIMLPQLQGFSTFIAQLIPGLLLLAIIMAVFDSEPEQVR
jgi:hypothetical protein